MKKTVLGIIFVVLALMGLLATLPIVHDELHWQVASLQDNAHAFKQYLAYHPSGRHACQASEGYDEHIWGTTLKTETIEAYLAYLNACPQGQYRPKALEIVDRHHWQEATVSNIIRAYRQYSTSHPEGRHFQEAETKAKALRTDSAIFDSAMKTGTEAALKQFLRDYPGHQKEPEVQQACEAISGRAIVDLEYPETVTSTGPSSNPTWEFRILFHERNGVAARINCTSLAGGNPAFFGSHWWHPSPPRGNIHLPANGTCSYRSWVRGESLGGNRTSVHFSIEDENGHSFSADASFTLKSEVE